MKKMSVVLGAITLAALTAFTSCSSGFKPFVQKDTGPKVYLMTGVNQMENGDFSMGEKHWGTFISAGGSADAELGDGKAKIKIKRCGGVEYAVQFFYDGIRIYHDGDYTLSFTASATAPKGAEVRIQLNGGDYHAYVVDWLTFTPEEKRFEMNFTMSEDSDVTPRLAFNMGSLPDYDEGDGNNVTVTIKDVSLVLNNTIAEEEKGNGGADFVRINQVGFAPSEKKIAFAKVEKNGQKFQVLDQAKNVVYEGKLAKAVRDEMALEYTAKADFSKVTAPGTYTVKVGENESFPFEIKENPYNDALTSALRYFYLSRCGQEVVDDIYGHPACHTAVSTNMSRKEKYDTLGGWHDAGDYGRYSAPGAKAVIDLLLASDTLSSAIDFDVLEEARYELDWLLKMQKDDGSVIHKVTCSGFPAFEMPEFETKNLYVSATSTCASADFAAAMALASVYYKDADPAFASKALAAAEKTWSYLEKAPFKKFKNESSITTGEYPDESDNDERYMAAAALALATGNEKYAKAAEELRACKEAPAWKEQFGWEQMEGYGDVIILTHPEIFSKSLVAQVKKAVLKAADESVKTASLSGFAQAQAVVGWGSNMEAMNIAHLLFRAYQASGKKEYLETAKAQVDYVFGANPLSRCYVTGYGSNPPLHPHHRPSIAMDIPQPGMLVGGPDQNLEDEFAVNLVSDKPALLCHVDNYQSFSTNEVTIYWNSALVTALALLYY